MITFTQELDKLTCDSKEIGNQYSDVTVAVDLTDDTFKDFNYVGLYVCDPNERQTFRAAVLGGKALLEHQMLSRAGDVYIALVGYGGSKGQLTTNTVPLVCNWSANPAKSSTVGEDWKQSTSDKLIREATEKAVQEWVEKNGLTIPMDDRPTKGSNKPVRSNGIFEALQALGGLKETGANFVRLGSIMVCFGTFSLSNLDINTATGSNFYTFAEIIGGTAPFAETGGFPACFTSAPSVWAYGSGITSRSWTGHSTADPAGIKSLAIIRSTAQTNANFTGRYIAVGRCDGARKGGAAVVTEALQWLGRNDNVGSKIVAEYNTFATDNQQAEDAAWCSEFWSVCAHRAGIPTDVAPYFAGGPRGAKKFSDIGCFYKLSGKSFRKATITDNSKANFAYTLGSETYVPQLGDVLWTSSAGDYPRHTAIVVSAVTDDDGNLNIFTIEGNMTDNDDESASAKTVKRMRRIVGGTATRDQHIFAVGRVNYPSDYSYGGEASYTGGGSSGGSGESGGGSEETEKGGTLTAGATLLMQTSSSASVSGSALRLRNARVDGTTLIISSNATVEGSGSSGGSGGGSSSAELKITSQPRSVTVSEGEYATFTIAASGQELEYQWQYRWSNNESWADSAQDGNKTSTLRVQATESRNGMQFRCVVTGASGKTVNSDSVTLFVRTAQGTTTEVGITSQSQNQTVSEGESVELSVSATGDNLTYDWGKKNNSGAWARVTSVQNGSSVLRFSSVKSEDAGTYRCVVTDSNGKSAISEDINLAVQSAEALTYTVNDVDGSTYGFQIGDDGYYVSNNKGTANSYAICRINLNVNRECDVGITFYQSSESGWDYGELGALDQVLDRSNTADSSEKVFLSLKDVSSTSEQTSYYNSIQPGQHFIEIKYLKDSSQDIGDDLLRFKVSYLERS